MSSSEWLRVILALTLFIVYLGKRYDWLGKMRERKEEQQAKEAKAKQQADLKERRRQERQRQEDVKSQTSEILRRGLGLLAQKSTQAAGQEIWYLEGGIGPDAPSVLLLHGFAGDKENWSQVGQQLVGAGFHVVAPDLPGFGQNAVHPDLGYDITSQAKRIRALIQKLKLGRCHLVGHSIGGSIAAAVCYAAPEGAASLTLVEPFGVRVPYESELDKLLANDRNPMVIANPTAYNNLLDFVFHQRPDMPAALKKHRAEQAAQHRVFYLKVWKQTHDGERAHLLDLLLPEVKVRTLVLQGAESKVVHPATPRVIQAMMNDARQVLLEGCGHFPMVEQPQQTGEHLLDFLRTVPPPASLSAANTTGPAS
ncbi:MAG: alpha/beta hydrolase [Acidobacteriota bacterium]